MSNTNTVGVQELIDRLKSEGVQEGEQQAEALLTETKKQAASIIEDARREAEQIVHEAQSEAERLEANGKRALALASRDTSLRLKEQLQHDPTATDQHAPSTGMRFCDGVFRHNGTGPGRRSAWAVKNRRHQGWKVQPMPPE